MTRLSEAGVIELKWNEYDDGTITVEGLQSYEIDADNELAVFQGSKCIKVIEAVDLCHAVSMVYSGEEVCRWNIHQGKTGNGRCVTEKGWPTKEIWRA